MATEVELPPSKTIYINNLNEKVKKHELRKSLYAMFSQFGTVLDVVALKTLRLRGQAFVVFKDLSAATTARRAMSNFPFYDKPMRIQFAKTKSDIVAKIEGTYAPREKIENPLAVAQKRKAEAASAAEAAKRAKMAQAEKPSKEKKAEKGHREKPEKKAAPAAPITPATSSVAGIQPPKPEALPPNKILFVQNLPSDSTDLMISMLSQQFPGFKEVRMVRAKDQCVAFVEYENEIVAGVALNGLQGFKITPQHLMVISFGKK